MKFYHRLLRRFSTFRSPKGFRVGGVSCGIKKKDNVLDLSLFYCEEKAIAAGVFTQNSFRASSIDLNIDVLRKNKNKISAVIVNSGNANAVTGEQGKKDTLAMQSLTAKELGVDPMNIMVLSTGVIGRELPMNCISSGIPNVSQKLGDSENDWINAANGIITTDKKYKLVSQTVEFSNGVSGAITGVAKGAGMIHPNMATMLSIITTDINISPKFLDRALREAVDKSFHAISVDGDTSTNDAVIILSSKQAGNKEINDNDFDKYCQDYYRFVNSLTSVCQSLAQEIVTGSEGASKLLSVNVTGAKSQGDARKATKSVATSILTKCAMFGGEPNWGRILCAVGYSGATVNTSKVDLYFNTPNDINNKIYLVSEGIPTQNELILHNAAQMMLGDRLNIHIDLHVGTESDTMWFPELSTEYVIFNSAYLT